MRKKGKKVDYARQIDNEIRILIECKPITVSLEKKHLDQLYRYFNVTSVKFAILTNCRIFNFYTALDALNRLNARPFFTFYIVDCNPAIFTDLKKVEQNSFNINSILATAKHLKYISGIKKAMHKLIDDPSEDFVRIISSKIHEGRFTAPAKEMLTGLTNSAFRKVIMDSVKSRFCWCRINHRRGK